MNYLKVIKNKSLKKVPVVDLNTSHCVDNYTYICVTCKLYCICLILKSDTELPLMSIKNNYIQIIFNSDRIKNVFYQIVYPCIECKIKVATAI